ncbi:MAG: M20/M25/M40 family metallo-hydrolase [Vicinamibacterales bacterium]
MSSLRLLLPFAIIMSIATPGTSGASQPAPLSPQEQAVARAVDARTDEAIALLEKAVNINSGTQNLAGVREVGALFRAEFDKLGFQTRWVDGSSWERAGHLVAEHAGPGPKILLVGHLDTVFEPDSPFQRFTRQGDKASGPGVIDMKGGDTVMVLALSALKDAGLLDRLNITVVMTGDEENSGRPLSAARKALRDAAEGTRAVIGFEDGDGNPKTVVIGRRGTTGWELTVKGTPAHSSQIFKPEIGAGAIYEAARILNEFRVQLEGKPNLTFNPGAIVGGTSAELDPVDSRGTAFGKSNVVAEHATVIGDLRALTPQQFADARKTMEAIVAASLPGTSATIEFDEGYPPLAPTPGNRELLSMYNEASQALGFGPVEAVNPDNAGAADVSFVADESRMIIDGVGLMGTGGHTVDETADLATLPMQAKRAAIVLLRLSGMR